MADLTSLSLELDNKTGTCRAIIETPKGCRNKFDYDPETGLFLLGGLLPEETGQGLDVDAVAPLVKDKFMSAFVRAKKPTGCCAPGCWA